MTIQQLINALLIIRDDPCSDGEFTPVYFVGNGFVGPIDIKTIALFNGECVLESR